MPKKVKRKITPSRQRYEQANPTVSARVPLATREKLLSNLKTLNLSLADALKKLAGELKIQAQPLEEARKQGFEEAKKKYRVTCPCFICGQPVALTSPKSKAAVANFMSKQGWKHKLCSPDGPKKGQPIS